MESSWTWRGCQSSARAAHAARVPGLTRELAYSSSPPMGANMTPTMKKRGRTVFGVKMGLLPRGQLPVHAVHVRCTHTATPSIAAAETQYLHVHQHRRSARATASRLTRGPFALRLLGVLVLGVLAGDGARGLMCWRHGEGFRAVPQRQAWVQKSQLSSADDVACGRDGPNVTSRRSPSPIPKLATGTRRQVPAARSPRPTTNAPRCMRSRVQQPCSPRDGEEIERINHHVFEAAHDQGASS